MCRYPIVSGRPSGGDLTATATIARCGMPCPFDDAPPPPLDVSGPRRSDCDFSTMGQGRQQADSSTSFIDNPAAPMGGGVGSATNVSVRDDDEDGSALADLSTRSETGTPFPIASPNVVAVDEPSQMSTSAPTTAATAAHSPCVPQQHHTIQHRHPHKQHHGARTPSTGASIVSGMPPAVIPAYGHANRGLGHTTAAFEVFHGAALAMPTPSPSSAMQVPRPTPLPLFCGPAAAPSLVAFAPVPEFVVEAVKATPVVAPTLQQQVPCRQLSGVPPETPLRSDHTASGIVSLMATSSTTLSHGPGSRSASLRDHSHGHSAARSLPRRADDELVKAGDLSHIIRPQRGVNIDGVAAAKTQHGASAPARRWTPYRSTPSNTQPLPPACLSWPAPNAQQQLSRHPEAEGVGTDRARSAEAKLGGARRGSGTGGAKLFVGQVPQRNNAVPWLERLFHPYGVVRVELRRVQAKDGSMDKQGNVREKPSTAFVWLRTAAAAELAVEQLHDHQYKNGKLWFKLCVERARH